MSIFVLASPFRAFSTHMECFNLRLDEALKYQVIKQYFTFSTCMTFTSHNQIVITQIVKNKYTKNRQTKRQTNMSILEGMSLLIAFDH